MNPLYSITEIRRIEQAAQPMLPAGALMQRAGQAAAQLALTLLAARSDPKILILAGPGNNGGDALETAYRLDLAGLDVTVALFADPARLPPDARQALQRAQAATVHFADADALSSLATHDWALVIDGLFGIGLTRPISGAMRDVVSLANALPCPMLALDIPSGLDADSGAIVGPQGIAIHASHTLTFIADKPGLHTCDGRDYTGQVKVAALEIAPELFPPAHVHLNGLPLFAGALHRRRHNTHKGSFGDVAVIGGAHGMHGAPLLAGRAALHCGAGRVFVAFIDAAPSHDALQPELMCRSADTFDFSAATVVAGPGAGMSRNAHDVLARALHNATPLVLDADALNLLAAEPGLRHILAQRKAATVLTPHPLEAARLLAIPAREVQADRVAAARQLASRFNATVILKGSGTVIARADGEAAINPNGNPALATAGTGDVLAGICGALLAQQLSGWQAALAAVWLHGHAADQLVGQGIGPIGLCASELIPAIRTALNRAATPPVPAVPT